VGDRTGSWRRLHRSARRLARRTDIGRLTRRRGDDSLLGLGTAKTTLAAVIAWELAERLPGTEPPVLAPLTALLVTQLTIVKTITGSLQRVASVTAARAGRARTPTSGCWRRGSSTATSARAGRRSARPRTACA